jgi:hypothetical protein
MLVPNATSLIDQQQGRYTPQLKEIPLLTVHICHHVPGVWQTDKGQVFTFPIPLKGFGAIWTNREYDCVTRSKIRKLITQLREMGAAIGSQKTAQKNKHYVFFATVVKQTDSVRFYIGQFKIRRILPLFGHNSSKLIDVYSSFIGCAAKFRKICTTLKYQ